MDSYTLSPAYGRDYTSKAKVEADLRADRDFILHGLGGRATYCNLSDLPDDGRARVLVRYRALRAVAVFDLAKLKEAQA